MSWRGAWEWSGKGAVGLAGLKGGRHMEVPLGQKGQGGGAENVGEGEFPWQKAKRGQSHEESGWKGANIERWYGSCGELGLNHNVVGVINWFGCSLLGGRNEPSREEVHILAPVVDSFPGSLSASR